MSETLKLLGIDAGGTFTDLVLLAKEDKSVLRSAKVPTDSKNMISTISAGADTILKDTDPSEIMAISIATTFATNALVENRVRPTALVLVGYDRERSEAVIKKNIFPTENIIMINGGHDSKGNEKSPLDVERLLPWLSDILPNVEAVAVSSFFSVRNPSHEISVKKLINGIAPSVYVTCGHELTSDLDALVRAETASLNANLIPIVMELFDSVKKVFSDRGINAPIYVVKSDGTLVSMEWAKLHPIETILSGPAASAVGARHLAHADKSSWVVDIGGTTTDIIYLNEKGEPVLKDEGATIGTHQTLIKTIDIYTFGLGGDSRVSTRGKDGRITVGPKRVMPLCSAFAGLEMPDAKELMKKNLAGEPLYIFPIDIENAEDEFEDRLFKHLHNGPISAHSFLSCESVTFSAMRHLETLETHGKIAFSAFTPTDTLHVLGKLGKWNKNASTAGAKIAAKYENTEHYCKDVYNTVIHNAAMNILKKSFERSGRVVRQSDMEFISDYLYGESTAGAKIKFELDGILIGAGAPTWAFIDDLAEMLGTKAMLPEHAEVTGAVGAAVGSFSLSFTVWINPNGEAGFRVHLPMGIADFEDLEEAVSYTVKVMKPWIANRSSMAGAKSPVIKYERRDEAVSCEENKIYMWTEITFRSEEENGGSF